MTVGDSNADVGEVVDITDEAFDAQASPDTGHAAEPATLRAQLEALLVVAEGPVPAGQFAEVLAVSAVEVEDALRTLAAEYGSRESGIRVRETASGWRLFAAAEHHELIRSALREDQPSRLTQAALETLAVVAYRQPVTRSRIGAIRGVSADAVVRTLVSRGLVVEVGMEESSGAVLYGTSSSFLEKLGLRSLTELPPLSDHLPDLQDVLSSSDVTSM